MNDKRRRDKTQFILRETGIHVVKGIVMAIIVGNAGESSQIMLEPFSLFGSALNVRR